MSECYSFVVNGVPCSTEEEKPLLRYLRDELRLTSVKDRRRPPARCGSTAHRWTPAAAMSIKTLPMSPCGR